MKKENDEITHLFRTRLADAEMNVRDDFWKQLSQDIPVACGHRRRLLLFRVAAAASVLLVLAASSAAFLYFSPKEEMEEAFTQAMARGGQMDGDGMQVNQLPLSVKPVLPKPAPKSFNLLSQSAEEEEDSLSFSFSMSFSFSSTIGGGGNNNHYGSNQRQYNGYWQAATNTHAQSSASQEETPEPLAAEKKAVKQHCWAMKAQVGMGLPAEGGAYKMPVSLGVTAERKLNDHWGIETGLLYSNLRSAGQHLHYLGIPVKVNATLMNTKKFDLYATLGGIVDKCIAGAPGNSFKDEPAQLGVTAGVGIHYKFNDRLALFAEPGLSHYFGTDAKLTTVRTKRPTNFNLLCGLRMTY